MAIDPKTAAKIAQIAVKIVKDEETRTKALVVILTPLIIVFILLIGFVHILASPLVAIAEFFNGDDTAIVEEFKDKNDSLVSLQMGTLKFNGDYPMPIDNCRVSSDYGNRLHPITKRVQMHTGLDLVGKWHANVQSVAPGQVVKIGIDPGGYGQYVILHHEFEKEFEKEVEVEEEVEEEDKDGKKTTRIETKTETKIITEHVEFYSAYAHLAEVYALPDQLVEEGSIIGLQGGDPDRDFLPGRSTGAHLHFEIRENENPRSHVDPKKYLYQKRYEGDEDDEEDTEESS